MRIGRWEIRKIPPIKEPQRTSPPQAGRLGRKKFDLYDEFDDIDPVELASHIPYQQVRPIDKAGNMLTAATLKSRVKTGNYPNMFANPMQGLDYRIYETLLKHTFIGALADAYMRFLVGKGFKPELELINPDDDAEKNRKEIEANQDIITNLMKIDYGVKSQPGELDTNFQQKIISLITSCLLYNRGALLFQYGGTTQINGLKYSFPTNMIFCHAQDLGIIETNPETWGLKSVQWRYGPSVGVDDMIYLWNPITSSKVYNSQHYGMSILSPLISASKLIRQLLSEDFPAIAKNTWAGMFFLIVKNEGTTPEEKAEEFAALVNGATPGAPNVLVKDPEDVRTDVINLEPKIQELLQTFESMVKLCISVIGLPQVGFYDESAANRSTMMGKIQLTLRTTIEPTREWIGQAICEQWYMKNFRKLYENKPELLEKFRIKLSWENLHIEEWYDSIEAAMELDGRAKIKDAELGELLSLDNYENMIDPDAEVQPGGAGNNKMSMTDSKTGNTFEMKSKKGLKDK